MDDSQGLIILKSETNAFLLGRLYELQTLTCTSVAYISPLRASICALRVTLIESVRITSSMTQVDLALGVTQCVNSTFHSRELRRQTNVEKFCLNNLVNDQQSNAI